MLFYWMLQCSLKSVLCFITKGYLVKECKCNLRKKNEEDLSRIFFPSLFRWKMTHDFHFSKAFNGKKNQVKWHLIPFVETSAISLIFRLKINFQIVFVHLQEFKKVFFQRRKRNRVHWHSNKSTLGQTLRVRRLPNARGSKNEDGKSIILYTGDI